MENFAAEIATMQRKSESASALSAGV
jgi:hypothetical protein